MPIPLGVLAQAGAGAGPVGPVTNAYVFLASATTSSNEQVLFDNLSTYSTDYKHLELRIRHRNSTSFAYQTFMRLNEDTGTNYQFHRLFTNNSEFSGVNSTAATTQSRMMMSSSDVNVATPAEAGFYGIIRILDAFNGNKFKTVISQYAFMGERQGVGMHSAAWRNTNAITSIRLANFDGESTFGFGTGRFALYGIKG